MPLYHRFALPAAAVAAALSLGAPAAAEVTRSTDDGFVSRHEAVVKADAKAVWLALITPADWWQSNHTWSGDAANLVLTPQAGGCFCETIPEVDEPERFTLQGSVEHMRVIQAYPEQALRMSGALGPLQSEPVTGVLTIAISKVDQGTRIVWEYNVGGSMRYEVPVIAKAVDGVIGAQLEALAKLLGPVPIPKPEPKPELAPETAPETTTPGQDKPAPPAGAGAGAAPAVKPTAKPAAAPAVVPAAKPAAKPAAGPAPNALAPKPLAQPAAKPAPKPEPKPAPKTPTVDDAFGDLKDDPPA